MSEITVKITGGLGNQLFILAAGIDQAMTAGCDLVLDATAYGSSNFRTFELGLLPLDDLPVKIRIIQPSRVRSRFGSLVANRARQAAFPGKFFREDVQVTYEEKPSISPGMTMIGYFQSELFGKKGLRYVLMLLDNFRKLHDRDGNWDKGRDSEVKVAIQVRRGDYLDPKISKLYGVCEPAYFVRAVELIRKFEKIDKIMVFTDSPDKVSCILKDIPDSFLAESLENASALKQLISLSEAKHHVISNSTFGWWAAALGDFHSGEGTRMVIAPRPWTLNSSIGIARDLLPANWITLDHRSNLWEVEPNEK